MIELFAWIAAVAVIFLARSAFRERAEWKKQKDREYFESLEQSK